MKRLLFSLVLIAAMLSSTSLNICKAQSHNSFDHWYIQAVSEFHRPFFTKDFMNFVSQNQSHVWSPTALANFGWEVGMPIPNSNGFKVIAEVLMSSATTLTAHVVDASVRYNLPISTDRDIFSVDLGAGHQYYSLPYYDQLPVGNIAFGDMNDMLNYSENSFNITQRLWNIHLGANYECKISNHLFLSIGLKYRMLMGDKTTIKEYRTSIDNFPIMSHHNFGVNLALSYYFYNL